MVFDYYISRRGTVSTGADRHQRGDEHHAQLAAIYGLGAALERIEAMAARGIDDCEEDKGHPPRRRQTMQKTC
jgi:hypothetical protein